MFLYLIYLFLALTPVVVWLFFYLKKDLHPEPKMMILKIFILGAVAACLAAIVEAIFSAVIAGSSLAFFVLQSFLIVALVEELAKYLVVKLYVFPSPELDEPLDVMLYMVISALGFAALENVVLFFATMHPYEISMVFKFALLRFVGAVFLHTLTSGVIGLFIAFSFCNHKNKKLLYVFGFLIAVALHGFYNLALVELSGLWQYLIPAIIIIILAIITTFGFIRLRQMKAICKIKAPQ